MGGKEEKRRRNLVSTCFIAGYLIHIQSVMGTTIIMMKIRISLHDLHKKDSKVGEIKKNIATYGFIEGEMASKS